MTTDNTLIENNNALVEYTYPTLDRNPSAVYLASLTERSSRVQHRQ